MSVYEIMLLLNGGEQSEDIVEHNGKQYRKVKRNAAVGELVVVTDAEDYCDYENGDVFEAIERNIDRIEIVDNIGDGNALYDNEYHVLEPIESATTLTETDLIANLAQEVAELKRQLTDAQTDIADLEDRLDENEKDVEEVIGRINDLGDGAEAAAVVPVAIIEKVIAELELMKHESEDRKSKPTYTNATRSYFRGKAFGLDAAITEMKGALRNG